MNNNLTNQKNSLKKEVLSLPAPVETAVSETSILPAIVELEKAYAALTEKWGLQLNKPIITIQTRGRLKALGWYGAKRWVKTTDDKESSHADMIPEINISAEFLMRGMIPVMTTLIHEMAHHIAATRGIKDCNAEQYHNQKFKEICEEIGLICTQMGRYGWAKTVMSAELENTVQSIGIREDVFGVSRFDSELLQIIKGKGTNEDGNGSDNGSDEKPKAKSKMKLWFCGCTRVRCAVELNAKCEKCGNMFELKD